MVGSGLPADVDQLEKTEGPKGFLLLPGEEGIEQQGCLARAVGDLHINRSETLQLGPIFPRLAEKERPEVFTGLGFPRGPNLLNGQGPDVPLFGTQDAASQQGSGDQPECEAG